jgi:hypothetical protein
MTKEKFLHLKRSEEGVVNPHLVNPDSYLENDPDVTVTPQAVLPGIAGTHKMWPFKVVKEFAAKVKHSHKFDNLTAEQRDILVVTDAFSLAGTRAQPHVMANHWRSQTKAGRKPWSYFRVYFLGGIIFYNDPHHPTQATGGHAYLVVMHKPGPSGQLAFHMWDSGWGSWNKTYLALRQGIQDWLAIEQWNGGALFYEHRDIPEQLDPVNCAQFMIHAAKEFLAKPNATPDYTGWRADKNEPDYETVRKDKKYEYEAKDAAGNPVHPTLDTVMKTASDQKVRDIAKIKKWKTKVMTGFK